MLDKAIDALARGLESGVDLAAGALAAIGANIAGVSDGLGRFLARLAVEARAALCAFPTQRLCSPRVWF